MVDELRTEEQIRADEALEKAIDDCIKAYGIGNDHVLSDFVVLCATQQLTDDGVVLTSHPALFKGGDIPWYRVLGLIEAHKAISVHHLTSGSSNG